MRILAIDASTKSCGVAIFEDNKLIKYDCITASSSDLIKRIQKIILGLKNLIIECPIDKVILEEVRPDDGEVRGLKTYRALMWLQAAVAFLLHDVAPKVDIEYVYPSEWRKACGIRTGRGVQRETLKKEDILFVKRTYNIDVNDDIADAIGIGYWAINKEIPMLEWGL